MAKKGNKTQNKSTSSNLENESSIKTKKTKIEKDKKVNNQKKGKEIIINALNKVEDNRNGIILFVIGFLIATLLFRCIFWPERIATLEDGTQPIANFNDSVITADDLYESMKKDYSITYLLNQIDNVILTEMYQENDEMNEEIASTAEYYYSVYEQNYGYTKENFLNEFGFDSEEDFLETLKLDYRRNKYYEEYALRQITDKEIEKYYEDEVFGDVDSEHILVSIDEDEGLSDEEAKALAEEIIQKLNSGTSWDDVVNEYKDQITHEELGYRAFNASLEEAYLQECKNLEVGTYSKAPVLTSYGYHIVYKIDQKEKPSLDDVKETVREVLADELKNEDTNLYYKALINMREEANLEFSDTKFGEEYSKYISEYK